MGWTELERLGTAGVIAIILLGIMGYRERQFAAYRREHRADINRITDAYRNDLKAAFDMVDAMTVELVKVIETATAATKELKGWLQGKFGGT